MDTTETGEDATIQGVEAAEAPLLARGTSAGRYTVLEFLDRGSMGAVYKAYDPKLDRSIALKVLSPRSSGNESILQAHGRLMREAQALAQLSHPNVVAVYDVGKVEGSVYIAMELVEGRTGREWLKEERPSRGEILEVFRQAGEGLLAAHQAGLVHRDFKPGNVILGLDGRVRVADFGLARSLAASPPPETEPVVKMCAPQARKIPLESGKYAEAEPVLIEAIQLALRSGMEELFALSESEATYLIGYHLQRHADGLIYSFHALGITRGRGDEVEARSLTDLASVYYVQGKYREAQEFDERALAIREKALGPDHLEVARSLNNLAVVYSEQGKLKESEKLQERALAIWEKVFGPDHPDVANALNNLGDLYQSQERYGEAEVLLKRALVIYEKSLGPEHQDVAMSLSNLGYLNESQGKHAEAEEFHKKSLEIIEKALGADHPYVAESLVGLAKTYEKQNRLAEALPLLRRARKIRLEAAVSAEDRAAAAFALARVLRSTGKERSNARTLAQEALELYQAAGPGAEKERREVERWIAEHK